MILGCEDPLLSQEGCLNLIFQEPPGIRGHGRLLTACCRRRLARHVGAHQLAPGLCTIMTTVYQAGLTAVSRLGHATHIGVTPPGTRHSRGPALMPPGRHDATLCVISAARCACSARSPSDAALGLRLMAD